MKKTGKADGKSFNPKSILITGGAGFIGSNVLRYLWNKYPKTHFHVVDTLTYAGDLRNIDISIRESSRFTFWYENITNIKMMEEIFSLCDYVVHFAAETHVARSIADDIRFIETDMLGTEVLLQSLLKNKDKIKRFIHISTSEVYGTAETPGMSEEHPLNPRSPYAAAKAGADRLVYSYIATYSIPAVIVRPFNLFGPNQHPEKVIPRFITSLLQGEPMTIHGGGESYRDFTHTSDAANAIDMLLQAPSKIVDGEVFNIGSERTVSVNEIASLLCKKMNIASPAKYIKKVGDRLGQVEKHISDTNKIRKAIGWKPKVSFEEGLDMVIEWYRNNPEWWTPKLFMKQVKVLSSKGKLELQ